MQQTASLFDYVVGAGKERRWHCEAERLGGLEVDDQFKFGWLFRRNVGGLGPTQNLINHIGGLTPQT